MNEQSETQTSLHTSNGFCLNLQQAPAGQSAAGQRASKSDSSTDRTGEPSAGSGPQTQNSETFFSGPIDLLLHLVKKDELPISSLSLAKVCGQYLYYIENTRGLDLEVASEYLVIAATLTAIKSRLLLDDPADDLLEEISAEGEAMSPEEALLLKLKEAEVFKQAAQQFSAIPKLGRDVFAPAGCLQKFPAIDRGLKQHDKFLLVEAFQAALKRIECLKTYDIILESVSIAERMQSIMATLSRHRESSGSRNMSFAELLRHDTSRQKMIGTFLGLLELCKRQVLTFSTEADQPVLIYLCGDTPAPAIFSSEFDGDTSGGAQQTAA